ncbi:MAG TPA: hypothetical protein VHW64_07720 [Nocardioides sp.]|uniref:hypothetical protein n=1 Tax=Nocardioides sp. TaxID=35761 RepID=UPI002E2FDA71|nr:hypothetical protein [Nocardioides sp.]HEX3930575.1 hypothetical protein [Nocardioides sp.]
MPLERGAVYLAPFEGMGPGGVGTQVIDKYHVILQDAASMDVNASQFAFAVGSSPTEGQPVRAFEVLLTVAEPGFPHDTLVDGRWVYTLRRDGLDEANYKFTLEEKAMDDISVAIFIGLQLNAPSE